jgi:heptaprenyl diphosphate synthase
MKNLSTREIASYALMLSMIFVIAIIEGMLPSLPMHMRFGLSNVVTMYALFFLGRRPAFLLATMKSAFVLMTRGPIAALLSLCGGIFSLAAIALLAAAKPGASYFILSITGAVTHNLAQLAAASAFLSANIMIVYLPVMLIVGVPTGSITALLFRAVMPALRAIGAMTEKNGDSRTCV